MHISKGRIEFIPHQKGLHYLDMEQCDTLSLVMVMTGQKNYEGYTKHEVKKAIEARKLQAMLGHPSQRNFEEMVHHNLISNCPVSKNDVTNAYKIFGPDLAGIQGRTVRQKSERVVTDYVEILQKTAKQLAGNMMNVVGLYNKA